MNYQMMSLPSSAAAGSRLGQRHCICISLFRFFNEILQEVLFFQQTLSFITCFVRSTSTDDLRSNGDSFSEKYVQRRERLSKLLKLRKVYSDILHAHAILASPAPAYQPLKAKVKERADDKSEMEVLESFSAEEDERARELAELEQQDQALWLLADMKLTADQLKVQNLEFFKNVYGLRMHAISLQA
jgi:hypothetical protein